MKILKLQFKNLNSLYGEWIIDFTNPEYTSNGIFALTGPTGAGKSTILDAICLALYGATPRLGKITKSENEIMSRQTGECYAEVLFESQAGRFICHWEQRRSRKKADGNLQDQEHQIVDADTGKPIETKKSLVGAVIEEKTGMDFERFTRSILLAQGGFDTFLKADVEQKSKILEQITGTEIYSQISQKVHERQRNEQEKLNILHAEISSVVILNSEQEKEIQDDLSIKQKQEFEFIDRLNAIGTAISWLTNIENLQKEISNLTSEVAKLNLDIETFKPERNKLEQAIKVASLDGIYAMLTAIRKQQTDDQNSLQTNEDALPNIELSARKQNELLNSAEQFTLKSKDDLKKAMPLIQKIRLLDQDIAKQRQTISNDMNICNKEIANIESDKQIRQKEQGKRINAEKKLEVTQAYLEENKQDAWLVSGLAGVEEQVNNMRAKQCEIMQKNIDLQKADTTVADAIKKLEKVSNQCSLKKQELELASKNLQHSKNILNELLGNKLLREYRTEKENLLREMAFIKKIEELENYRNKLEDGKPCPLCGSIEHPFAEGNVPASDEIDKKIDFLTKLIETAEEQESVIKNLEQKEIAIRNELNNLERLEIDANNNKKDAEKTLIELTNIFTKLHNDFNQLTLAVLEKLQPLGITKISASELKSLIDLLKSRLKLWQDCEKQKVDIEKQIASIDSEIKRLDAVIDTQIMALTTKQEHLEQLKKELLKVINERKELYSDKSPDYEEKQLNKIIVDAEKNEKTIRDLNIELQQKFTTAKNHIESLKKRIEHRADELKTAETDFLTELKRIDFVDEQSFIDARMPSEKREILSSQAKKLDNAVTELNAKHQDRKMRLASEVAKKITDKTLDELNIQFKDLEKNLQELRNAIAKCNYQLSENTITKERIKQQQFAIESQKKECYRWDNLHRLIGSSDGKKYRNFAQGLTFELMVAHANRQLEKMTDRYLLIRDEQQPLELNVVDNYQAGEIRSTKNLSGGESFIVSLTLALGLSKMASRKVRVDSLFLDEGFGTLDEEALETALQTLSGLQQDAKLIGVISHVPAMKERISTQINITPVSGGRSLLSGPGCVKK